MLSVGDPVEVRKATPEGDVWVPATVDIVTEWQIAVAYADGRREVLPRGHGRYRDARSFRCEELD